MSEPKIEMYRVESCTVELTLGDLTLTQRLYFVWLALIGRTAFLSGAVVRRFTTSSLHRISEAPHAS